jgi:hypothetical protein
MRDNCAPSPDEIEAECQRLGHRLGWRFLTCPKSNIETAKFALVTINPGGDKFEAPLWSVEAGSAYVIERWKGFSPGNEKLQRQVRRMFEIMDVCPERVLSGYLVPFRSPNWAALAAKEASLQFGVSAWRNIFRQVDIKTVIAFGKDIARRLTDMLEASEFGEYRAEWGDQTIDVYRFGNGGRLIVLPHLSRFALFNRPNSERAFRAALTVQD